MPKNALYHVNGGVELLKDIAYDELKERLQSPQSLLWIDLIDPDKEELNLLERTFELHPLTIEDCINTNSRPKIDSFDKYMFVVLHGASTDPKAQRARTIELNVCIGANFVITIHHEPLKGVASVFEKAQQNSGSILKGSGELFHRIVDSLVDNYLPVLDVLDRKINDVEEEALQSSEQDVLSQLFTVKKDLLYMRRIIGPQREIVNFLSKVHYPFISAKTRPYFRDVYDNSIFINDTLDTYRDLVDGALEAHLSTISNKTNDIVRVLTIISTIMMPLTLISGIYGMNFSHMPILKTPSGFWVVSGVMVLIAVAMLAYFKRKRWL